MQEMKEKYLECGFDDYLSKPIEKVELYRVVYKYLNKKQNLLYNNNRMDGKYERYKYINK